MSNRFPFCQTTGPVNLQDQPNSITKSLPNSPNIRSEQLPFKIKNTPKITKQKNAQFFVPNKKCKGQFVFDVLTSNATMLSDPSLSQLAFCTSSSPLDWYNNKYGPRTFEIFPRYNEWNHILLGTFLNELVGFYKTKKSTDIHLIFRRNVVINDQTMKWKIYIDIDKEIQVKVSYDWLKCNWFFMGGYFLSNKGKGLKMRKNFDIQYE